ncbi:MAG: hypothetical protein Q7J35_03230, partial [Candidatus Methanoperedens sp.]|nr:hypothetical protein [Candidatus Methanoperedens sp.]
MKNKILMIAALFAVMVAMTGIAAADTDLAASPNPVILGYGGTTSTDITYTGFGNGLVPWRIELADGSIPLVDEIVVNDGDGSETSSGSYSETDGTPNTMIIKDLPGDNNGHTQYWLATCKPGASFGTPACIRDAISVQIDMAIPEFATVALPVAA